MNPLKKGAKRDFGVVRSYKVIILINYIKKITENSDKTNL